jgi:hypothetical protein
MLPFGSGHTSRFCRRDRYREASIWFNKKISKTIEIAHGRKSMILLYIFVRQTGVILIQSLDIFFGKEGISIDIKPVFISFRWIAANEMRNVRTERKIKKSITQVTIYIVVCASLPPDHYFKAGREPRKWRASLFLYSWHWKEEIIRCIFSVARNWIKRQSFTDFKVLLWYFRGEMFFLSLN